MQLPGSLVTELHVNQPSLVSPNESAIVSFGVGLGSASPTIARLCPTSICRSNRALALYVPTRAALLTPGSPPQLSRPPPQRLGYPASDSRPGFASHK